MKKSDLVKKITSRVDVTAAKAGDIVNVLFESIAEALGEGDSYNQDRFGTFKVVDRAPRKGRNPRTGETIDIPGKKAVKFVVSGKLKDKLNK
ncbi:MAG: HU family DNA-binding protein [archaeon]